MHLAHPILIVYQQLSAQAENPFQAKCNNNNAQPKGK